jgi:hypothetical protein
MEILSNALKFTHKREYEQGGFTLYKGIPDTKNTYYGVKILEIYNEEPYNKEKTIEWIQELQEGRMYGIQGLFYRVNILNIFREKIRVHESYISRLNVKTEFTNLKVAYYHAIISKILELNNIGKIANWILSYQNEDGGYGSSRSDISSTYYALEALNFIDPSLIEMKDSIIDFTLKCLTKEGGFTFIPDIYPPYLEPTYEGIRIQEILGIEPIIQNKTIEFVQKLQNSNGGFRRSKYLGISELEYTFKSLYILKSIY